MEKRRYWLTVMAVLVIPALAAPAIAQDVQAMLQQAKELLDQKQYDQATGAYGKLIAEHPDCAEAYDGHGTAYRMKGEFDKALSDLDKAIELAPDSDDANDARDLLKQLGEGAD